MNIAEVMKDIENQSGMPKVFSGATIARPTEIGGSHFYYPDGRPCYEVPKANGAGTRKTNVGDARKLGLLPSPTTILKQLAKPQLDLWKQEQACLAVLTSPRREGEALDDFVYRVLHAEREQDAERDAAADEGTAIHNAIELALSGQPYDQKYEPHVEAVRERLAILGRVVFTEKILVGDGYAGRTDCGLENDDEIIVVDFKGCKQLPREPYVEHRMQIAAYCAALGNTGDKIVSGLVVYIDRNTPGLNAVHMISDWSIDYQKFKCLLAYWKLANNIE